MKFDGSLLFGGNSETFPCFPAYQSEICRSSPKGGRSDRIFPLYPDVPSYSCQLSSAALITFEPITGNVYSVTVPSLNVEVYCVGMLCVRVFLFVLVLNRLFSIVYIYFTIYLWLCSVKTVWGKIWDEQFDSKIMFQTPSIWPHFTSKLYDREAKRFNILNKLIFYGKKLERVDFEYEIKCNIILENYSNREGVYPIRFTSSDSSCGS